MRAHLHPGPQSAAVRPRANSSRATIVDGLSAELAVSARTLDRRFRSALGGSPTQYLQEVRVDGVPSADECGRPS